VFQTEQVISENGDKFDAADKDDLQAKVDALKEALKGSDTNLIKSKQDELQAKFYEVSAKLYQQNAPQGDPTDPTGGFGGGANPNPGEDYTDVNYTDVD